MPKRPSDNAAHQVRRTAEAARPVRVRHNEENMKRSTRDDHQRLLQWVGSHEVTVLLAVAGIAAGVWMFAALAGEVGDGDTQAFDRNVLLALRQPGTLAPLGPPAVQDAARDITALGGIAVLAMVTMIAAGFLILDGKRHMALFVCGSVVSGLIAGTILKDIFQRPRPDVVPRAAYVSGASFPAGIP